MAVGQETGGVEVAAALKQGGSLFLMHENADPDAVASAFALQQAFGGTVAVPGNLSLPGRRLAAALDLQVDPMPHPEKFPRLVAVDTSSRAQIRRLHERATQLLIVDHHAYGDLLDDAHGVFRDPERSSCAEVVLDLLDQSGRALTTPQALALFVGIVADTARFRWANARTFEACARLTREHDLRMAQALTLLEGEEDEEEGEDMPRRVAQLKGAQRARIEEHDGFLFATSEVSAHEAGAALALVRAGADLALVLSQRSERARVSLRAHPRLIARGVHLGEVANRIARESGWSGGGHEAAAGLNGSGDGARVVQALAEAVARILKEGA